MGILRQIDFILIDRRLKRNVHDAGSIPAVDMGSDHNTLLMKIRCQPTHFKKKAEDKPKCVNCKDVDSSQYLDAATKY